MADETPTVNETPKEGPYILHVDGKKVARGGLNAQQVRTKANITAVQVIAGGEPRSVPIGTDFEVSKADYTAFQAAELPEGYAWGEPKNPEGSEKAARAGAETPGTPGEGGGPTEGAASGGGTGDTGTATRTTAPATARTTTTGTNTGTTGK